MKAMQDYVDKVVEMSSGDAGTLKAMRLMTKTQKQLISYQKSFKIFIG